MTSKAAWSSVVIAFLLFLQGASTASAYYNPSSGRFLSRDPIMYPDGANTYAAWYVPASVDPFGLDDVHIGNLQGMPDGNTAGVTNGQPIYQRGPGECFILTRNGEGRIPCPAPNGKWTFNPRWQPEANGFGGNIKFDPLNACPRCPTIKLVQTARSYASEGNLSDWGASDSPLDNLKPPYVTKDGWFVDVPIEDYERRVKAKSDDPNKQPTYYYGDYMPTGRLVGSSDGTRDPAQIFDAPNGYYRVELETCAICVESGAWLGCLTWSVIDSNRSGPITAMRGGPSRDFLDAIKLFQNNSQIIR